MDCGDMVRSGNGSKMVLKDEDENGNPDFEMAGVRDFRGSAQGTACEAGGARQ